MTNAFTLEYWRDGEWFVGKLRGIPGVFSQGETLEDLEENVRDAYAMMVEGEEPAPEDAVSKELVVAQ